MTSPSMMTMINHYILDLPVVGARSIVRPFWRKTPSAVTPKRAEKNRTRVTCRIAVAYRVAVPSIDGRSPEPYKSKAGGLKTRVQTASFR